ncbi:MAG TPA: hypothetical protein VN087_04460 [Verrucomicrobiae bacterium]|jgi:hypothetical protein|nr:hypothetical protein [Verrucomicrobiae bacterium]
MPVKKAKCPAIVQAWPFSLFAFLSQPAVSIRPPLSRKQKTSPTPTSTKLATAELRVIRISIPNWRKKNTQQQKQLQQLQQTASQASAKSQMSRHRNL